MGETLHVVMLPWSAFGHMMPFFQLSVALAKTGIRVSYVQTPMNIRRLPKIPQNLESLITFVEIPFPVLRDQALPQGAEATVDITFDKMLQLKSAYDFLHIAFRKFVVDQSPDWLLVDLMPHWAVDIAEQQEIGISLFTPLSAGAVCFLGPPEYLVGEGRRKVRTTVESFTSSPHWVTKSKPSKIAFSKQEAGGFLHGFYGPNGTDKSDAERIAKVLIASKFVAIRSCDEIEGDYLKLASEILDKPVIPVGLLPPEKVKASSVIDETSDRGHVCVGWAPQMEILGHPAIGASLFHSGWGSVIETLQFGHTLVVLPFIIDQPLNAKLLVEKKLAVEIEKNEDGSFSREEVAKGLKLAMVSDEGESLRVRAREAGKYFGDHELHNDYIARFVEYLKGGC
ncbi:hypothetical protein ACFE04_019006 [Oxalis oulophora]